MIFIFSGCTDTVNEGIEVESSMTADGFYGHLLCGEYSLGMRTTKGAVAGLSVLELAAGR